MIAVSWLPIAVVSVAAVIAAVTDLRSFRIHNALTLPLLASGLLYHAAIGGTSQLLGSLLAAMAVSCVLVVFCLMGGVGAGDIKLMAGIGSWLGLPLGFVVFVAASMAAGLYALILIVVHARLHETWVGLKIIWHRLAAAGRFLGAEDRLEAEVQRPDCRQRLVPFAVMTLVGVVTALLCLWFGLPL